MRRRRFLAYAATLGGASLGLFLVHPGRRRERVLVAVESFVRESEGERWLAIGRDYLSRAPGESDLQVLSERLFETFPWSVLLRADVDEILRDQVRDDFVNERLVSLRGWQLSVTEARLCALKLLLRDR